MCRGVCVLICEDEDDKGLDLMSLYRTRDTTPNTGNTRVFWNRRVHFRNRTTNIWNRTVDVGKRIVNVRNRIVNVRNRIVNVRNRMVKSECVR